MSFVQADKYKFCRFIRAAIIVFVVLLGFSKSLPAKTIPDAEKPATGISLNETDEPKLSKIIPLSTELSARFAKLENANLQLPDLAAIENAYSEIAARVNAASRQLESLRSIQTGQNIRALKLKRIFIFEKINLSKINAPFEKVIDQLDDWGKEWQREQKRWQDWQASLLKSHSYSEIKAAFDDANAIIDSALEFISLQLGPLLVLQSKGARLSARIENLEAKLTALQTETRKESLVGRAPPMYSLDYYTQYGGGIWAIAWENLKFMPWPGKEFFILHGLELGLLFLSIIVILTVIYRKRQAFAASKDWAFVAERPLATVLFITSVVAMIQMQFWVSSSSTVTAFVMITGSMSCLRLLFRVLKNRWARKVSLAVMSLFSMTIFLIMAGLPVPIFNLFIFVSSVLALAFTCITAVELKEAKSGSSHLWVVWVLSLWFAMIIIAEILGETGISYSMFVNSIITLAIIALIVLFIYMLRGGIHWIFFSSTLWQVKLLRSDAAKNEHKVLLVAETLIFLFVLLPAILYIWDLFDSFPDALSGVFSFGFEVGGYSVTFGMVIAVIATLYGSLYVSQLAPKLLLDEKILGRQMDRGVRGSIGHLIRYFIIFIGLLLTLALLGFNLTNLTIILSALGVGIGFGLQGIVNNFVSGLILLFERPIREGDTVEIGSLWASVKNIGMRATIIQTYDMSEVIIPNADLVNNQITNWTLSNRQVRLNIPVGVDYGSDVSLVVDTLMTCAKEHVAVMKSPAPEVIFTNLGESSLDFILRVWIEDNDNRLVVMSQLFQEIVQRFREAGIVIPFPQRDLHHYGLGDAVKEKGQQNPDKGRQPEEDSA